MEGQPTEAKETFKQFLGRNLKSTKVHVIVVATVALWAGKLSDWAWVAVAGTYVGANIAQKIISRPGNGGRNAGDT